MLSSVFTQNSRAASASLTIISCPKLPREPIPAYGRDEWRVSLSKACAAQGVPDLSVLIRTAYVVVWNLLEISTRESSTVYLPSIPFDRLEKF